MARDYNEQLPDGSWQHVVQNDDGTYRTNPIPPSDYAAAGIPTGTSGRSSGASGPGYRDEADLRDQLQRAGYGGPWDLQSMIAAYNRARAGAGGGAPAVPTGAGGFNPGDYEGFNYQAELLKLQAARDAAQTAYNNAMLQHGNQQLALQAAVEAATMALGRASATGYYQDLSPSYMAGGAAGGTPSMSAEQALDAIWAKRDDLASFYQQNGWDVSTPEARRLAVQDWLGMTNDPAIRAANGDPVAAAKALGIDVGGTAGAGPGSYTFSPTGERIPTLARQQFETAATGYYNGTPTLAREAQEKQTGLSLLNLLGQMRGARNAFQAQNVAFGANALGLDSSLDALLGSNVPAFQAPQAAPQRVSFATMAEDLRAAGRPAGGAQPSYTAGQPGGQAQADNYRAALKQVAPNKIVGRTFFQLPQETQDFYLSGFEDLGWSPNYVLGTARRASLPSFQAPAFGQVS